MLNRLQALNSLAQNMHTDASGRETYATSLFLPNPDISDGGVSHDISSSRLTHSTKHKTKLEFGEKAGKQYCPWQLTSRSLPSQLGSDATSHRDAMQVSQNLASQYAFSCGQDFWKCFFHETPCIDISSHDPEDAQRCSAWV